MFTVLGSSGHTGSVVASSLLAAGKKVRLFVRDASKVSSLAEQGAEVQTGRMESVDDVSRALEGAEGAYLLLPPGFESPDPLATNRAIADVFRAALEKTKVPHVVLLSSIGAQHADGTGPIKAGHYAETALRGLSSTRFTFLRAGYFFENLAGVLHPMKVDGVLPAFTKDVTRPIPMVSTRDIGETAARALLEPPKATEILELGGPEALSYQDAARAFAAVLGRDVKAVSVPYDAIAPSLTAAGVPASLAALYREMAEGSDAGLVAFDGTGRAVRGRLSIAEFAKSIV